MVVPFTLRQLEYFAATAELGSFRAAAAECRVTETALAQSVTDLEKSLGQTLFIRQRSRGVTPTSEGRALLVLARSLLDHATEVSVAADELRSELSGPLRIGCYSTLSPFIVPSIIDDFAMPHPRLDVTVVEGDPYDLQGRLVEGKLDCVLLQRRQAIRGVETRPLRTGEPKVILSADHRLARNKSISLRDLADEPMVLLDLPAVRETLLPMLAEVGIEPRIGWRTTVFETVRSLVARNLGWALLIHRPPIELSYENRPLVTLRIAEPIASSDVSLGILRDRRMNARLLAFEQHCVEHFRRLDGIKPA
ncbi:LysR substrate-binding domain-containing protein [Agromyces sp. M3QZ16-3]|uniref:LysR substrate-binding domain-containing protein n=1 Tax=Agromyces sp. M3QZ16-3 TaxID=3447585 RepID=UPI003F692861